MKKLCVICLVLMTAIGVLGVAYSAWSQTLNIDGTVNTGSLSAVYIDSNDTDVAVGDATYTVTGDGTDTLTVNIDDAYPGLNFDVPFYVTNTGTIPIEVTVTTTDTNTLFIVTIDDPGVVNPGETSAVANINFNFLEGTEDGVDQIDQSETYTINAQLTAAQNT